MTSFITRKIYRRASHVANNLLDDLLGASGLRNSFYRNASGSRILIYHGVCTRDHTRFNSLFVTKEIFEKQLRLIKRFFHPLSLDDFYAEKFHTEKFNICLTFDDGFANNYRHVLPLLEQYQVPATFFVTAIRNENIDILWNDFLTIASVEGPAEFSFGNAIYRKHRNRFYYDVATGQQLKDLLREGGFDQKFELMQFMRQYTSFRLNKDIEDYWLQMTVEEIRRLAASPMVTIGSHGHYHNDLARISKEELEGELRHSKLFLESIIQKPVRALAFPYGSYSGEVLTEAERAGYRQLLATSLNASVDRNNPLLRERMGINPYIGCHSQLTATIKGRYHA
jgi:peptidoglycan/xylan/chitin deacetylase (PgdA/CDA1 family)